MLLLCPQELSEKLIVVVGQDDLSKEAQRNATTTFMTNLRANLASKRVLGEYMSVLPVACSRCRSKVEPQLHGCSSMEFCQALPTVCTQARACMGP